MKMYKKSLLAVLTAVLSVTTTNALAKSKDSVERVVYSCQDNKTLEVVYVNSASNTYAIINQVGEMVPMAITESASGSVYKAIDKNYTYQLFTKGKTAFLTEGNDKPILSDCSL